MSANKGLAHMALVPMGPRASSAFVCLVIGLWEPLYPLFMLRLVWVELQPLANRSPDSYSSDRSCQLFSSVQSLSSVWLFATPWTAARQASLSITKSQSLLKLMSTESVMPSNHLILCCPLLLLPSIFPSIRDFSDESVLHNQVAKVLEFQLQHQSLQWIFKTDFL